MMQASAEKHEHTVLAEEDRVGPTATTRAVGTDPKAAFVKRK